VLSACRYGACGWASRLSRVTLFGYVVLTTRIGCAAVRFHGPVSVPESAGRHDSRAPAEGWRACPEPLVVRRGGDGSYRVRRLFRRRGSRVVRHQERRVRDTHHFPAARTLRGQRAAADSLEIGKRGAAMRARGKPGTSHGISFQRTRAPLGARLVAFAAARLAGGLATGEAFRGGDGGGDGGRRSRLAAVVQPSLPPFRTRTR
jgi:hypothetical protein